MSGHKRNRREMERDFQKFVGDLAEHKPRENARKFFDHKAYECKGARNLIKVQGEQIEHESVLSYLERKGVDTSEQEEIKPIKILEGRIETDRR